MSRHSNSSLFLIGIASMVAVWVTVPFWSRSPQKGEKTVKVVKTPVPVRSGFQYAVPEGNPRRANVEERGYNQEQLKRQLDRRAHMEKAGLVKNVIENEAMPPEIRSRFLAEKKRLDMLAEEYPQMAAESEKNSVESQIASDGSVSPDFQEAMVNMKSSGVWDELHRDFVRQLQAAANDERLPPEERPRPEDIEAIRAGGFIPSL